MTGLQNGRILRFLIAIGAVVLTIFVYASYYSSTSMGMSSHVRASQTLISSSSLSIFEKYLVHNLSDSNGIDLTNSVLAKSDKNDKNVNGFDLKESNAFIDMRMLKGNLKNLNDKIKYSHQRDANNSTTNGNKQNSNTAQKSNEGDSSTFTNSTLGTQSSNSLLIPTTYIQTFILNADKILTNLSASQSSNLQLQQQDQAIDTKKTKLVLQSSPPNSYSKKQSLPSIQTSLAQPPSAFVPANRIKPSKGQTVIDPTQGIPTHEIYESGHLDVSPLLCPDEGEPLKLLIIITSAHSHQDARLSIRQTWGHYAMRRDVAIAFILGYTQNQTLENSLNQENYIYGDLIRGHFIDSYNNLTLKTISALEWVDQNCPQAKFVLKTDDDMFINVPKLMAFLDKHQKDKRVIYGRLAKKWKPIRNKKSKYYVSSGQFGATIFPPFTTGPAYVMTADIIHDLYVKALQQTYLKLEDVFTTGIVAQQLGIRRIHVNEFLNRRIAFNPCNIRKTISVHMIKSNEQFDLWKKLLDQSTNCK